MKQLLTYLSPAGKRLGLIKRGADQRRRRTHYQRHPRRSRKVARPQRVFRQPVLGISRAPWLYLDYRITDADHWNLAAQSQSES